MPSATPSLLMYRMRVCSRGDEGPFFVRWGAAEGGDEGVVSRWNTPHPTSLRSATFDHKGRREGAKIVQKNANHPTCCRSADIDVIAGRVLTSEKAGNS